MRDRIAKLVSIGALLVVVFCLGMVWPKTQLWPTSWFKQANVAASAFHDRYLVRRSSPCSRRPMIAPASSSMMPRARPARLHADLPAQRGWVRRAADRAGRDGAASLADQFDDIWPAGAPQLIYRGNPERGRWHGVHLFPNGDVLLNLELEGFPYAGGLVKLDKDSKVLWKVERNIHHAVTVLPDGTILVAGAQLSCRLLARPGVSRPPDLRGRRPGDLARRQGRRRDLDADGAGGDGGCPAAHDRFPRSDASQRCRGGHAGVRGGISAVQGGRPDRLVAQPQRGGRDRSTDQARQLDPGRAVGPAARCRPAARGPDLPVRQPGRAREVRRHTDPEARPGDAADPLAV